MLLKNTTPTPAYGMGFLFCNMYRQRRDREEQERIIRRENAYT